MERSSPPSLLLIQESQGQAPPVRAGYVQVVQVHLLKWWPLLPERRLCPSPGLLCPHPSEGCVVGEGTDAARSHVHHLQSGTTGPHSPPPAVLRLPLRSSCASCGPISFLVQSPPLTQPLVSPPLLHHLLFFQNFVTSFSVPIIFPSLILSLLWAIASCGAFLSLLLLFTQPFRPLTSHLPPRVCTAPDR